eukprot:3027536-Prymnesium_polylepis.1
MRHAFGVNYLCTSDDAQTFALGLQTQLAGSRTHTLLSTGRLPSAFIAVSIASLGEGGCLGSSVRSSAWSADRCQALVPFTHAVGILPDLDLVEEQAWVHDALTLIASR